jgi:SAM-dependent methyltransferase
VTLGDSLRAAGLTPRALDAWAGTDRLSALPARLPALVLREITPSSAALALFVAGAIVRRERLRLPLAELGDLIEPDGAFVRARVAILPLGPSLMVCDRLEASDATELVCWPDDSSHHLANALPPGRRARWLDLGCGSAFAPLARPELAAAIAGLDVNPRAVDFARLGARLSGVAHLAIAAGDLGTATGPAELVTCNAPIPEVADRAVWRHADDDFFARLWRVARATVAPDGLVVIHATSRALRALAELRGERVTVLYTRAGDPEGFGIAWWRPGAEACLVRVRRALSDDLPHLTSADRDAAIAGELEPLAS